MTKYNQLVSLLLTDPSSEEAPSLVKLYTWVIVLSESVSLLDKTCAALVDALLHIDWATRDNTFAVTYMQFLQHLVSAQSFYTGAVIDSLVGGLHYRMLPISCFYIFLLMDRVSRFKDAITCKGATIRSIRSEP